MIQIHSRKQPIQIDSESSRDVPQVSASSLDNLDHCRIVFGDVKLGAVRNVGRHTVNWRKYAFVCEWHGMTPSRLWRSKFPLAVLLDNVSKTQSQNWRAGTPSTRKRASGDITSDSPLLWETAVCIMHIHEIGTHVCDPNTQSRPPGVGFESRKSPANETSWNKPSLQSSIWSHTWPNCL